MLTVAEVARRLTMGREQADTEEEPVGGHGREPREIAATRISPSRAELQPESENPPTVSCVPTCPVRVLTLDEADAIETEMRRIQSNPRFSKEAMRLFMQAPMPCGHAAGNLMTCDREPFGCVICNSLTAPSGPPAAPSEAGIKNRRCPLVGTIVGCVRCGGTHGATAYYFASPPKDFTAWATCPVTGDPILIELPAAERGAPPPAPPEARG
jgi:hypothetical protein